jgi:hypothetical protein
MCVIRGRPPPPPSRYAGPLGSSGPGTGRTSSRRSGISQAFSILAEADPRGRYGTEPGGPGPARDHIVKAVDQPHELAPSAPDPARNRYMELAPAPTRSATVLLMQPVASPEHLQASAVDHHVNRPIRLLQGGRDTQAGAAAREGRMIRHREIEAAQVQDRPQQALDLTPRPTESQPQHQPRFDRDIRIALRSAPPTGRRRCQRGDRLGRHPDRQAAAAPHRTRPSSEFCTEPSGSCDDAVHWPCTASALSGSAGDLYTRPASAATAPATIFAPRSPHRTELQKLMNRVVGAIYHCLL